MTSGTSQFDVSAMPEHLRDEVLGFLAPLTALLPRDWEAVRVLFDADTVTASVADCRVADDYHSATITFYPLWCAAEPRMRLQAILHELRHITTEGYHRLMMGRLRAYAPEGVYEAVEPLLEAEYERMVDRLAWGDLRLLEGGCYGDAR